MSLTAEVLLRTSSCSSHSLAIGLQWASFMYTLGFGGHCRSPAWPVHGSLSTDRLGIRKSLLAANFGEAEIPFVLQDG